MYFYLFLQVFTVDKIQSLSSAQANSVTTAQYSALSPSQQSAVTSVATTATDDTDNGE